MGKNSIAVTLAFILIIVFVVSCDNYQKQGRQRIAVAKAGDLILYYDQIPNLVQPGMSSADSIVVIRNYINKWAKKEILKLKAIENLSPEFKSEVEKEIAEIRTNLLIHRYQQQMIDQKLDTIIAEEEIERYYASSGSTFILNTNIVKALFIRMPENTPGINSVAGLYRSDKHEDITQLELICYQYADKYDDFDEEWIPLTYLLAELPVNVNNQEEFLRKNSWFETSDENFRYFVRIREYKLRSETAPYEYARNNIRSLILNTRKMEFLLELENGLFNEAIRSNKYIIFNKS